MFVAVLGSLGLVSIIVAGIILAQFSRRLGEVIKMRPYYQGFYLGVLLVTWALGARVSLIGAFSLLPPADWGVFPILIYQTPLATGVTLILGVALRYWGWLLRPGE